MTALRSLLAAAVLVLALPGAAHAAADLQIAQADTPDPVSAGGNITYTITVSNVGDAASSADVTDTLPSGLTTVSFSVPAGWSKSGTTAHTNSLAAGASATLTLVAKVPDNAAPLTTYDNTAAVSPGTSSSTERTTVGVADLALAQTDDLDPIAPGRDLRYTLTLTNPGTSVARSVSLQDPLPDDTTFVSAAAPPGWTTSAPAPGANGTVTFSASSVPAGASHTFTIVAHVSDSALDGSTLVNPAAVTTSTAQLTTQNDAATETTGVSTRADLVTEIAGSPNPAVPGGRIAFDVRVANVGAVDARDVALSDGLGPGLTFVSSEQTEGPPFTCADVCGIANLPSRTAARFTVVARADLTTGGTTLFGTAGATTSTAETRTDNNSSLAGVAVARIGPDLGFRYSVRPRTVTRGKTSLVTLKVVNRGNGAANAVALTETLSRRLGYVRAKASRASCRSRRPRVICSLRSIKPGQTKTVKLTVLAARLGRVKVKAAVASREPDLNPANNAVTARLRVRR